jgi:hypothetical protein
MPEPLSREADEVGDCIPVGDEADEIFWHLLIY